MRALIFILGILVLVGIPLLLNRLGPPPATAPQRMRESEVDAREFDRLQAERALQQESADPFEEDL
jgi:hypothetical protein